MTEVKTAYLQAEHFPGGAITPTSLVISKNIRPTIQPSSYLLVQGKQKPMSFQVLVHKVHYNAVSVNGQQWRWWRNLSLHHQVNTQSDCSISMPKNATQGLLLFEVVGVGQTHVNWKKRKKKNQPNKKACAKTNWFSLCGSTRNESPVMSAEQHLTGWKQPSTGTGISEMEFLIMPVIIRAHVQTETEKDLCPFHIFQFYLLIMFNRKLWTGKSNFFKIVKILFTYVLLGGAYHGVHVEVKGQLVGVVSLLLPWRS